MCPRFKRKERGARRERAAAKGEGEERTPSAGQLRKKTLPKLPPPWGTGGDSGGPKLCNLLERRRIALCNLVLVYKPKELLFLRLIDLQSGPDPFSERALGKGAGFLGHRLSVKFGRQLVAGPPGAARAAAHWPNNVY